MIIQTPSYLHRHLFTNLMSSFGNSSLLNGKGELLYSQDPDPLKTTTSRLVCFQVVKKYLNIKPNSTVICNDSENGGTDIQRLFFVSSITNNLYLVWDTHCYWMDLKIPPTPWLENGVENQLIMTALFSATQNSKQLKVLFEKQKLLLQKLNQLERNFLTQLSDDKFQKQWFKVCQSLLQDKLKLRAEGDVQKTITYKDSQIKIRAITSEKIQYSPISIDFSGTSSAEMVYAATHLVESGLLVELIKFYGLEGYLCQPLLNAMKLILPPQSMVAKAHPKGLYNFELQKISRQLVRQCLVQINSTQKKEVPNRPLYSTYFCYMKSSSSLNEGYTSYFSNSRVQLNETFFEVKRMQNIEKKFICELNPKNEIELSIRGVTSPDDLDLRTIKLNNKVLVSGDYKVLPSDCLTIDWKLN